MDGEKNEGQGLGFVPKRPDEEQMDLATAREVLGAVVNTSESTFTETSDPSRVEPYNTEQIREALLLVSQDVIQSSGESKFGRSIAEKQTPSGKLSLIIRQQFYKKGESGELEATTRPLANHDDDYTRLEQNGLIPGEPTSLVMHLTAEDGHRLLYCELPLKEEPSIEDTIVSGFRDNKEDGRTVTMYHLLHPPQDFQQIEGFRHMWRGLRWLSDNILNWKGDSRLPEDLDKPLPSKDKPPLLEQDPGR
jgi:hypothetical protein